MKLYLLNYDDACGTEREVLKVLNKLPEVLNWSACLPFSVFIVSDLSERKLARLFTKHFGDGMFVVAEVDGAKIDGLLPDDLWDFVNEPQSA